MVDKVVDRSVLRAGRDINIIINEELSKLDSIEKSDFEIKKLKYKIKLLKEGLFLYENKKYELALSYFNKFLDTDSTFKCVWNIKGIILKNLKKDEEALRAYDRALEIDQDYEHAWCNKGEVFVKLRKYEEALKAYNRALEIDPNYAIAWHDKGITLIRLDRYDETLKCFDRALEIYPDFVLARKNRDIFLKTSNKIEQLEDKLKLKEKAQTLFKNKEYELALSYFNKVLEIDPDNARVWYIKGATLRNLNRYEEAIICLDRALEIDPEYNLARKNKDIVLGVLRSQGK